MPDISVIHLVKSFEEDKNILDDVSFEVLPGERVGLLGRNGAGKTTLFRIMTGQLNPSSGEVVFPAGKRVGLISQIPRFPAGWTGEDVLKSAHERIYAMRRELDSLESAMGADPSREELERYDRLLQDFSACGGYELDRYRNVVANGLRIPQSQRDQLFDSLSGGEKTRMNLARLMLEDTEILLLDEPTNHLDLQACQWLEEWLLSCRRTVLAASHDRYFLDRVVTKTVDLENGRAEVYKGNYSFYLREHAERLREQQARWERETAERKRLEEARDRLHQWGTGNEALMKKSFAIQSRLDRMEHTDRPKQEKLLRARFEEKIFRADEAVSVVNLSKSFGSKRLFSGVDLEVTGRERIAVIGNNGSGKSTLIRILLGLEPADTGSVRLGPAVKTAYLEQAVSFSHPERSVLDTLLFEEGYEPQEARDRLGAFGFRGEDVFRPVGGLSGGEQSRLRLCLLMRGSVNLLVLDEPTNHLDAASRQWMEDALEEYGEALLFVSHDRYFIRRFATRIWELEDGTLTDWRCGWDEYLEKKAAGINRERDVKAKERKAKPKPQRGVSPAKALERAEREIAQQEKRLAEIAAAEEENASDYAKLMELAAEKEELSARLELLYEQWETLSLEAEG